MIRKVKLFLSGLLNRGFYTGLDTAKKRANELHASRYQTVVCVYCGKLLPKSEAGVVFDIKNDLLEYSHDECFARYEKIFDEMPAPLKGENHER